MHSASFFHKNNLLKSFLFTLTILTIPLIGMLTTEEVNWDATDFIVGGIFIYVFSMLFQLAHQATENISLKVAYGLAIVATFLLVWVNLAVGLIGSKNEPFNLAYFSVIATGLIGAFISKMKLQGLRNTMIAMSLNMVIIGIIALLIGMQFVYGSSTSEIIRVTIMFTITFTVSAYLFHRSSFETIVE